MSDLAGQTTRGASWLFLSGHRGPIRRLVSGLRVREKSAASGLRGAGALDQVSKKFVPPATEWAGLLPRVRWLAPPMSLPLCFPMNMAEAEAAVGGPCRLII